ncbi:MAG TPA: MFS transporter [Candidatus Paceibacterota bacterium]|nr:MFS transporter [Verrucomicrobiota bacterium]HRY51171.1 MFS transporter [Candidatus Paceibacterota bacterium]HSA02450.1 MFS transporter [Candidatus Paceibacterota bacterium]
MSESTPRSSTQQSWLFLGTLVVGYMGVYLCRKNFAVANPLIREEFGLSKSEIGWVASASTLAYMAGKFAFGPVIDRFGGRISFVVSLGLVALFGLGGACMSSLLGLTVMYSLNRFAGAAAWGGMVKQTPEWFDRSSLPFAMAVLSLSFVFGGFFATLLRGWIAGVSGDNWRFVMGGPALVLIPILGACASILPRSKSAFASDPKGNPGSINWTRLLELGSLRQFWVLCALSFTLTLLRETFGTWAVDFFATLGGPAMSLRIAAFLSTPFDALGALGILLLGWAFGRLSCESRTRLLVAILAGLAVAVFLLPSLTRWNLYAGAALLGLIGFLAYGPFSLLAGILAVEVKGSAYVASVAGMVDGFGYLASILAGQQFGRLLDIGGYSLGFTCLAGLALLSAFLSLALYPKETRAGSNLQMAAPQPNL